MAKYTMYLKDIVEQYGYKTNEDGTYEFEDLDYGNIDEIMNRAIPRIFDFDFPIYNESHRNDLCKLIIMEYLYQEIAYDTPGHFKLRLRTLLNEIMPRYNKLYESVELKYNPLHDVDFTRNYEHQGENVSKTTDQSINTSQNQNKNVYEHNSNDKAKNKNAFSDTPQGTLQRLEDGTYMSSGSIDDNESQSKSNGEQKNISTANSQAKTVQDGKQNITSKDVEKIVGKRGMKSIPQMILEDRQTYLNIDLMIVQECRILFLALWH